MLYLNIPLFFTVFVNFGLWDLREKIINVKQGKSAICMRWCFSGVCGNRGGFGVYNLKMRNDCIIPPKLFCLQIFDQLIEMFHRVAA